MSSTSGAVVYAGKGASHSWTWLADLFENSGVLSVRFLGAEEFRRSLDSVGTALISGGDGMAIAEELRGEGFRSLEKWISRGGKFVGVCAGAYLPLPSSLEPFSEFNLSTTKIENIVCRSSREGEFEPRREIPYGDCSIVHPVRVPVLVGDAAGASAIAPIYGGPAFKEPSRDAVMMRYLGFTKDTEFQTDPKEAERMFVGRPAAIRAIHGEGSLLLFGPHLEHPRYSDANVWLLNLLGYERQHWPPPEAARIAERAKQEGLHRAIADLKVAVFGLENRSFVVGRKAWDGSRYIELISALEKRAWSLSDAMSRKIEGVLRRVRDGVVASRTGPEAGAEIWTNLLLEATRETVDLHFAVLSEMATTCVDDLFGWPEGKRLA